MNNKAKHVNNKVLQRDSGHDVMKPGFESDQSRSVSALVRICHTPWILHHGTIQEYATLSILHQLSLRNLNLLLHSGIYGFAFNQYNIDRIISVPMFSSEKDIACLSRARSG